MKKSTLTRRRLIAAGLESLRTTSVDCIRREHFTESAGVTVNLFRYYWDTIPQAVDDLMAHAVEVGDRRAILRGLLAGHESCRDLPESIKREAIETLYADLNCAE